ncbi:ribosomal protein L1 [Ceraceosorus guamensis]|uniref:Ribosomal protein n=1 Tax=Ceraceosorus guamensis TaxID=1522189 RepID=A0A316WCL0_9BASI|nr:ribosomal protein L1 [Ceraceosorus guamensis]PWN45603.1 ribosomal protein L1 [Ceraceosorus guamensis]
MSTMLPSTSSCRSLVQRISTSSRPLAQAQSSHITHARSLHITASNSGKHRPGFGRNAIRKARQEVRVNNLRPDGSSPASALQEDTSRMGARGKKKREEPASLEDAFKLLTATEVSRPFAAFEIHIATSISRGVANALRGRIALPYTTRSKPEVILIFAGEGNEAGQEARRIASSSSSAGSSSNEIIVGGQEIIPDVVSGRIAGFTKVLATPDCVGAVAKALARSLGPKGLMPNAKRGTIVQTRKGMREAIEEARGALDWKGDKQGVVRTSIARVSHPLPALRSNISSFLAAVVERASSGLGSQAASNQQGLVQGSIELAKRTPAELKKAQSIIRGVHISSTQGPGIKLDLREVY